MPDRAFLGIYESCCPQDAPQAPALRDRNAPAFLDAASNQDEYFKCPSVFLGTNASLAGCPCALPSLLPVSDGLPVKARGGTTVFSV